MNTKRLVAAAALVVLAACGSAGSGVSTSAAARLNAQIDAVRAAAAHGDRHLSALRLAQLRANVASLEQNGQVSDDAAARILRAAQAVQARLMLLPAPTTTSTTTTTTTEPDDHHHRPKDDKGPGRKHGAKHDDEG